jgi:hypothetical protein
MIFVNDMTKFFNYIQSNQHRGLFTSGYDTHYNIIQAFLIKDNTTLNQYSLFIHNHRTSFPNMQELLEIINFVNLQSDCHRRFCIQIWISTFRRNEIAQLENELRNVFLS